VIRLIIIEDDETTRRNLVLFSNFQSDIEVIRDYVSVEEFMDCESNDNAFDVLILDIGLPGISGLEAIPLIKLKHPSLDIIMLTAFDEHKKIFLALQSGACSYLTKSTTLDKIMDTVRIVFNGGSYMSPGIARKLSEYLTSAKTSRTVGLSPRQIEVMTGLVDGHSYKDIAGQLVVSVDTIRTHIKRIYQQLHVKSKAEAVAKYLKR